VPTALKNGRPSSRTGDTVKEQTDAPKVRSDPFWLVLQESCEIGELPLHPGGHNRELLLEVFRLETQLVADSF